MFLSLLAFSSLVFALPDVLQPTSLDVWAPEITSPDSQTVWAAGCTYPVTWDISNPPTQLSNPQGAIYLRHNDSTQSTPIKQGFLLTGGEVNVTVPVDTQPDKDWIVVLMGDSGDWSSPFTITGPSAC